jgi:hypothetical protein
MQRQKWQQRLRQMQTLMLRVQRRPQMQPPPQLAEAVSEDMAEGSDGQA